MALPEEHKGGSSRPLSIRAFADLAETSPRRIRRLIRQGRLRTTTNSAGETRIPESELSRLEGEKQSRLLKQSMELAPIDTSLEVSPDFDDEHGNGAIVSLQRHEAAMVRLGYIESELASSRRMLQEAAERQQDLEERADEAEQDAVAATVRAVEAETALEDMRSQVIDSTFKAMELEKEVEDLREVIQQPWWKKIFGAKKSEE
jgi:hypothetical protein